ncbi:hypothetical protein LV779_22695 [Streptomyces thinghirensis]|nr:hypothetical protein [Streptomyces thinghirensis]
MRLLDDTPGGTLVLAGAHRRAGAETPPTSPTARTAPSTGIVLELQERGVPGIQLHGFAESTTDRYAAVLSTGRRRRAPPARSPR